MGDILDDLRKKVKWDLDRHSYQLTMLRSEILSKLPQGPGVTGKDPLFEVQKKMNELGVELKKLSESVKLGLPKFP